MPATLGKELCKGGPTPHAQLTRRRQRHRPCPGLPRLAAALLSAKSGLCPLGNSGAGSCWASMPHPAAAAARTYGPPPPRALLEAAPCCRIGAANLCRRRRPTCRPPFSWQQWSRRCRWRMQRRQLPRRVVLGTHPTAQPRPAGRPTMPVSHLAAVVSALSAVLFPPAVSTRARRPLISWGRRSAMCMCTPARPSLPCLPVAPPVCSVLCAHRHRPQAGRQALLHGGVPPEVPSHHGFHRAAAADGGEAAPPSRCRSCGRGGGGCRAGCSAGAGGCGGCRPRDGCTLSGCLGASSGAAQPGS